MKYIISGSFTPGRGLEAIEDLYVECYYRDIFSKSSQLESKIEYLFLSEFAKIFILWKTRHFIN